MMNSIAPFWDGNETWLILGGGGLFVAFPLAYAILMPAMYLPVTLMLLGLVFRGVAFEFRFKAQGSSRKIWDYAFHFGSMLAAFMQGVILGAIVQGIAVTGRQFSGGAFDWLSAFSIMTGIALMFGYALLGATWMIMKTQDGTQVWARYVASYTLVFVAVFMGIVSLSVPFINEGIKEFWFSLPNFYYLFPIPLATGMLMALLWRNIHRDSEYSPFFLSLLIFLLGFVGLALSLWPWIVPYNVSWEMAAAASTSQSLALIGTVVLLPIILSYTAYVYYVIPWQSELQ